MKYLLLVMIYILFGLSIGAQRTDSFNYSYFVPQPNTFKNVGALSYPYSEERICDFLTSNIQRIAEITPGKRNVYNFSQKEKEFIRLIEVLSGIRCIDVERGFGYGIDTRKMVVPQDRILEVEEWIKNYCEVITMDIIYEARRLLPDNATYDRILRLQQNLLSRKDHWAHREINNAKQYKLSNYSQNILQEIDSKFVSVDVYAIYLTEAEQVELSKLLSLLDEGNKHNDLNILTIRDFININEIIFRATH